MKPQLFSVGIDNAASIHYYTLAPAAPPFFLSLSTSFFVYLMLPLWRGDDEKGGER